MLKKVKKLRGKFPKKGKNK